MGVAQGKKEHEAAPVNGLKQVGSVGPIHLTAPSNG